MDDGIDVLLMGELDFKNPLNATIVYSDSDDDVSLQSNKPENIKMSEKVEIKSEIESTNQIQKVLDMPQLYEQSIDPLELENDVTIISETKIKNNKKPAKRKLSLNKKDGYSNTESVTGVKNVHKKENGSNERNVNRPTKRKTPNKMIDTHTSIYVPPTTQQIQLNQSLIQNSKTSEVVSNESEKTMCSIRIELNNENAFATPIKSKDSQVLQIQNASTISRERSTNNSENNCNTDAPSESSVISNHKSVNSSNDYCLQSLVNTVSVHLMLIIKAQNCYSKKICEDKVNHFYYKDKFSRFKAKIHDLSYSAVLISILPRETDEKFAKTFIHNTVSLAHSKSLPCSEEQIRTLYLELINGVKNRKREIMSYFQETPQLYQLLSSKSTTTNNNNGPVQKENTILTTLNALQRIQKQYPNETIETGTTVIDNVLREQNYANSLSKINQFVNQLVPPNINNANKSGQVQNEPNTNTPANHLATKRPPPSYNYAVNRNNNMIHPSPSNQFSYQTVPNTSYPVNSSGNINNPININNSNNVVYNTVQTNNLRPTNHRDTFYTQPVNSYPANPENIVNGIEQALSYYAKSINQTTPTAQYELQHNQRSNSQMPLSQSKPPWTTTSHGHHFRKQYETLAGQAPDEAYRSSISRDSGFYSPPNIDKNNDQPQPEHLTQQTPLITHVTSLNPNRVNIAEGPCHVCRKLTNKKCVACYKSYYCSYECQTSDWIYHMAICKM